MTQGSVTVEVIHGDNLVVARSLPDAGFPLIYLDPPFNTGRTRTRTDGVEPRAGDRATQRGFRGTGYARHRDGARVYVGVQAEELGGRGVGHVRAGCVRVSQAENTAIAC